MEIIEQFSNKKEGNECYIYNYISLVKMDTDLYSVTHVAATRGGWTGNPTTSRSEVFTNIHDATGYFGHIVKEVQ